MSRIKILILLARILGLTNPAAFSQGAAIEWDTLNEEVRRLYQAGDHKRATVIAEKALKVAEENVGPPHPIVGTSLNNLAGLYQDQGECAEAEPL